MDSWVVGQISFWYTVYEINPTTIVDKIIDFWIKVVTPGRGAGESHWMMRGLRAFEQGAERTNRELEVRRELRDWDNSHPQIHHELIVRYLCGAVASVAATAFYNAIVRPSPRGNRRHDY